MPPALLEEIGQIAVRAKDLPRATTFYRDTLGLTLTLTLALEAPNLAFFQAGAAWLMCGWTAPPASDMLMGTWTPKP